MNYQNTIDGFLSRNLPEFADSFIFEITDDNDEKFEITCENGKVHIAASNLICAFHGFYCYLKKYCGVQLSWCANNEIKIEKPVLFDGVYSKKIEQKRRVYLNYCTLGYSMSWWDFDRWEKEIDFMAMNGINMTLAVIGSEAVLYETMTAIGFSEKEALSCVSSCCFYPWQLMTNFSGYRAPDDVRYVYDRLELGNKILERFREFGITPIQQGFSGNVAHCVKDKFPNHKIYTANRWCNFDECAQICADDGFFFEFGRTYLEKLKKLMGAYGYYACDPFHENAPPKKGAKKMLEDMGEAVCRLYREFDPNYTWVIQGWTLRYELIKNVPVDRLIILDLNSARVLSDKRFFKYQTVAGMLHNFGGKNSMQGKLNRHCENLYAKLKNKGINAVGSGIFSEGIEQNPVVYDLQFAMLTQSGDMNIDEFIRDYITRRYSRFDERLYKAWQLLLKSCYRDEGYAENEVGSALASHPQLIPEKAGPCCKTKLYYDPKLLEDALKLFLSVSEEFSDSDGYQYDLCDIARQALSNRFYTNQLEFAKAYKKRKKDEARTIAEAQLALISDLDSLLGHRGELCLSNRLYLARRLGKDEEQKRYYAENLKLLISTWGDNDYTILSLHDYSWREWHGHIKNYYYVRWQMFYEYALDCLKRHRRLKAKNEHGYSRKPVRYKCDYERRLAAFEKSYYKTEDDPIFVENTDVIPDVKKLAMKYFAD